MSTTCKHFLDKIPIRIAVTRSLSLSLPPKAVLAGRRFPRCDKALNTTSRGSEVIYVQTRATSAGNLGANAIAFGGVSSRKFVRYTRGPEIPLKSRNFGTVASFPLPLRASRTRGRIRARESFDSPPEFFSARTLRSKYLLYSYNVCIFCLLRESFTYTRTHTHESHQNLILSQQ